MSKNLEAAEFAIETDSPELVRSLTEEIGQNVMTSKREGLDGVTLTTVILTVTPFLVTKLVRLLTEGIKARQYVRVIYKGITIQGVSEATLLKIIKAKDEK